MVHVIDVLKLKRGLMNYCCNPGESIIGLNHDIQRI